MPNVKNNGQGRSQSKEKIKILVGNEMNIQHIIIMITKNLVL